MQFNSPEQSIIDLDRSIETLHSLSDSLTDVDYLDGSNSTTLKGDSSKTMDDASKLSSSGHRSSAGLKPEGEAQSLHDDVRVLQTEHRTFEAARDSLAIRLPRANEDDSQRVFVPRFVVRELFCLYPDDVKSLFLLANLENLSSRAKKAERFYHAVIGSSGIGRPGEAANESNVIPEEKGLSVFLAMLLWVGVTPATDLWQTFERMCLLSESDQLPLNDACLPMAREDLEERFGKTILVEKLWDVQYTFRPFVLQKSKFILAHRNRRIPYLEDGHRCGRGSVGNVFKCRIPRGHLESRTNLNKTSLVLARKEFLANAQGEQAAKLEQLIHEKFMLSSVTRHTHIMQPIASLRHGSTINFFYDLARCDLLGYMKKGPDGDGDGSPPTADAEKLRVLQQFIHVASALEFLHNGIQAPGYDRVICYHLDLKPENILVVRSDDPKVGDVFKISDFGISRVHYRQGAHKAKIDPDGELGLDIASKDSEGAKSGRDVRTQSELHESSTYISPEGLALGSRVSTSSDVWAFGCMLCTLLSWLHGGWAGVEAFSAQRKDQEGQGRDYFFKSEPVRDGTETPEQYTNVVYEEGRKVNRSYQLNPAVGKLFDDPNGLIKSYIGEPKKQAMHSDIWSLLREDVLTIHPDKRSIRMNTVRQKLVDISGGIDQFEISSCQPQ